MFQGDHRNAAIGLTLLRVTAGLILLQAGYAKVFIQGFGGTIQQFKMMGVFLAQVTGPFVAALELVGGAALVLGIWPRYLGGAFSIQFVVATYVKVVLLRTGWEAARIDLLLVAAGVVLLTQGGGAFGLGELLKKGS